MIVTKKALRRRTFLRGMGVTLGLPLLDAMTPALSAMAATPAARRLGYIYIPMGMNPASWIPKSEGKLTELSPSLASLAPYLDQVTVVTNTELKDMTYPTGNHAAANAIFLSNVRPKRTEGNDYELATTVDQLAAKQLGKETAIPSLELSTDLIAQVGNCDNGLACAYQNNLSWSSPKTPLPAEADPRVVFERLFGDGGNLQDRSSELRKNRSILDWVTDDMARLQGKLSSGDRTTVSNYLDAIREAERRIQKVEERSAESPLPQLDRPSSVPAVW